jgi:hypothetical protein
MEKELLYKSTKTAFFWQLLIFFLHINEVEKNSLKRGYNYGFFLCRVGSSY